MLGTKTSLPPLTHARHGGQVCQWFMTPSFNDIAWSSHALHRNATKLPAFVVAGAAGGQEAVAAGPRTSQKGSAMNWDRIEGNWKQFTGKVKEKWGKLTDDEIAQIDGNREQLEGKIQARYGYAKDQVRKDVDDWLNRM
jgi:uncharacterized protein YjbJ (UPF0337 family)